MSYKSIYKRALAALAAAACAMALTACDEHEYTDPESLGLAPVATTDAATPDDAIAQQGGGRYTAEQSWKESAERGKVRLNIDAAVSVPEAEAYPVIKVADTKLTQEDADKAFEYLAQGAELSGAPVSGEGELTDNSEQIAHYTRVLEQLQQGITEIDGETYEQTPEEIQQMLDELQATHGQPVEQGEMKPITGFDQQEASAGGHEQLIAFVDLGREHKDMITVQNIQDEAYLRSRIKLESSNVEDNGYLSDSSIPAGAEGDAPQGVEMTQEAAKQKALEAAAALGAELEVASARRGYAWLWEQNKREGWVVRLRRNIGGIPVLSGRGEGLSVTVTAENAAEFGMEDMFSEDQATSPTDQPLASLNISGWLYEEMVVCIDDSGIVYLDWGGRVQQGEYENESAKLLPFDEVKQAVLDNADRAYALSGLGANGSDILESVDISITDMRLGLMRLPVAGEPGQSRLVPAWALSGTATPVYNKEATLAWMAEDEAGGEDSPSPEEQWQEYFSPEAVEAAAKDMQVQMVINALDGEMQ